MSSTRIEPPVLGDGDYIWRSMHVAWDLLWVAERGKESPETRNRCPRAGGHRKLVAITREFPLTITPVKPWQLAKVVFN